MRVRRFTTPLLARKASPKRFARSQLDCQLLQIFWARRINALITGDVDEDSCKGVKNAIEACEIKARKLNELFCEVISADGASRLKRYRKAIKAYGKGNEVENLMKGILENVLLLTCERGLKTATSVQQDHVFKAIEEVLAIPSSMHESALQGTGFTVDNYGPGVQTNYIAQGENIAQGEARQYNSMGGDMNFGKD